LAIEAKDRMKTIKSVISENKDTLELKGLIEVYEELAATKMQKIRAGILASRDFFEGLSRLSDEVGSDFAQVIAGFGKKTAAVFLGANTGLYGEIIDKTFGLFLDFIRQNRADVFVVGELGQELMRQHAPGVRYQLLNLDDDKIDPESFRELVLRILPYRRILVFYGKFKNLAVQLASQTGISGDLLPKSEEDWQMLRKKRLSYLYEPSLEGVSGVFAKEILTSIFEQTLRESQLARFASRLMRLDQAIENVNLSLAKLNGEKRSLRKKILGKKQNIMISGVMARAI
jgi:F0F1-type ATP synthase gamma subunit